MYNNPLKYTDPSGHRVCGPACPEDWTTWRTAFGAALPGQVAWARGWTAGDTAKALQGLGLVAGGAAFGLAAEAALVDVAVPAAQTAYFEGSLQLWRLSQEGWWWLAERYAKWQLARRVSRLLSGAPGYNVSPEEWFGKYEQIGRAGTFITDRKAIASVIGDFEGKGSVIYVTSEQAARLEQALGLQPGSLTGGFRISRIENILSRSPASPLVYESELFLGPGKGLPGGGPELIIESVPTRGGPGVTQIIVRITGTD